MQPRRDKSYKKPCSSQWMIFFSLLVLSLSLPACTHRYGAETVHDISRYLALQPGVSTKADVRQRFGQPADVLPREDGSQWRYLQTNAATHWATFILYAGRVAGGNTLEVTQAVFVFDAAERYRTVDTSTDRRYQNMWASMGALLGQSVDAAKQRVRGEMAHLGVSFDEKA